MLLQGISVLCFIAFLAHPARAQKAEQEANLKAVFIYNFTKYIEWTNNDNDDEFRIGVLGQSEVTNSLLEIARANRAKNKRIVIKQFRKPEDIDHCDILFIAQNPGFPLESIMERVDKGTLTVSEVPGYARLGTAFNFVVVNDKLKFEANRKALYAAGLRAGSQLMKLAIIVD